MDIVSKGVLYGVVLAFLIGPVFFTIIQTSIERGFANGAYVAAGVTISDSLYILIAYLGLSQIVDNPSLRLYLGYGGGLVLFLFGMYYLLIKSRRLMVYEHMEVKARSPWRCMAKGFIINGLSPMVLLFWVGTVSVATGELGYTTHATALVFFASIVATVFCTDLLKAMLADRLRLLITPRLIRILNIVLGLAMVGFGSKLLFFSGVPVSPVIH
jgi:threonine/homoserine/homoserine lactone efflux protein